MHEQKKWLKKGEKNQFKKRLEIAYVLKVKTVFSTYIFSALQKFNIRSASLLLSLHERRSSCMPSGITLKVTGSASTMPGATTFLPFTVSAADAAEVGEKDTPLNRDELSLYAEPQQKSRYVEPEAGQLEEYAATLRKSVNPYAAWYRDTYAKIKPGVQKFVQFGYDAYAYAQSPPKDFYPRAGIIGFTGVLGLFLGRGSRVKKLVYPASLMTASASLYYPEQAAGIAKSTGDSVYDYAVRSYAAVEKILSPRSKDGESTEPETKP